MSADIARACGITYRQLDHWTRLGYLHPAPRPIHKSGYIREWPPAELAVAADMGRLVRAGFTLDTAHRIARADRTAAFLLMLDAIDEAV